MMYVFLANNRGELIERCRAKVAQRQARDATAQQLRNGVPMLLDQLIRTTVVQITGASKRRRIHHYIIVLRGLPSKQKAQGYL